MHVAVVRWPEERELRSALRAQRLPRLLIVEEGATPPVDADPLEDWAGAMAPASELEARIAALGALAAAAGPATPVIDDDDVVRFGDRWVALGPVEARVARPLVERIGALVPRAAIESAAWGNQPVRPNTTDRLVHRLRAHLAVVGLGLVTVRGHGYVLEAMSNLT